MSGVVGDENATTKDTSPYGEGDAVYARNEGMGEVKLYIEEIKESKIYKLRTDEKKGEGVLLNKEFNDTDLLDGSWDGEAK